MSKKHQEGEPRRPNMRKLKARTRIGKSTSSTCAYIEWLEDRVKTLQKLLEMSQ